MNDIKNDINLREAVRRQEQQLPPLPDDLNERVRKRIVESETASKPRRLWVYAAVAVAASIAVLSVFTLWNKQRPQEPYVAQQRVKPVVVQSQPVVEELRPEVVAVGQPVEKPVTALSEDVPQQAESASTQNVSPLQTPPGGEAPPLWEGAGGEAEPFFLASTSYVGVHRSFGNGLANKNVPDDSCDDVLNLYSAKDRDGMPEGWADLRKWSQKQVSQSHLTKKERQRVDELSSEMRQQKAVLSAIARKRWHIDITSMNTQRYGSRTVTSDFYLELRGDTLRSYLPYLGQVHMPTMSPSIGLNFEEPVLSYKEGKQIDIRVRTREDSYHYVIEINDNGQAYIRVRSMKRDPISFDGTLEIE